jgi:dCTP diphosphatase
MSELEELKLKLRDFSMRRGWNQFHTPKNLAMALAGEMGELLAEFQWLTPEESGLSALSIEHLDAVKMEIADIFLYLVSLADLLEIDLYDAAAKKISINESRFPEVRSQPAS